MLVTPLCLVDLADVAAECFEEVIVGCVVWRRVVFFVVVANDETAMADRAMDKTIVFVTYAYSN